MPSVLRSLFSPLLRGVMEPGDQSVISRAIAILRSFGSNASSYPFATRQGAYQDTGATTPAVAVNDPIGLELDAMGTKTLLAVSQDFTTWTSGGAFGNWNASTATATTITATGALGSRYIRFACAPGNFVQFAVNIVAGTTNGLAAIAFGTSGAVYISDVADWPGFASGPSSISAIAPAGTAFVEIVIRAIDAGGTVGFTGLSATLATGNHATQTTAINRPTFAQDGGGRWYAVGNGTNRWMVANTGGGASTAFFMCVAFQTAAAGVAQTLWSDRSGNTGLKLEITAGNVIQFSGGNGASINTATGNAVSTGTAYVVTAKYDGANLSVQLNNAAAVTAACTLSAGTAAITIMADPGGASGFFNGGFYDMPYIKNGTLSGTNEAVIKTATGQKAGLVI